MEFALQLYVTMLVFSSYAVVSWKLKAFFLHQSVK
jgi:hypothetical protein